MNLAGHEYDDYKLAWGVMHNLSPRRGQRHVQRWVLVKEYFGVGSTVAYALCNKYNLDPEDVIK